MIEAYKKLLEDEYQQAIESDCVAPNSKLGFIGNHIFEFTTYSNEIDEILAKRMLLVCRSIIEKTTFNFIDQSDEAHIEFITMCNFPFLMDKLEWGTSIRGAWFCNATYKIDCENIIITDIESFIKALIYWSEE